MLEDGTSSGRAGKSSQHLECLELTDCTYSGCHCDGGDTIEEWRFLIVVGGAAELIRHDQARL